MLKIIAAHLLLLLLSTSALAGEVSYRNDILPLWKERCSKCHGAGSPYLGDFLENENNFRQEMKGPRMDTYANLIFFVGWPDTGALMRRLDAGNGAERKPGNMFQHLGKTEAERQKNLSLFKAWVGEEGWIFNAWDKKGDVPGVTKDELSKMKLKY